MNFKKTLIKNVCALVMAALVAVTSSACGGGNPVTAGTATIGATVAPIATPMPTPEPTPVPLPEAQGFAVTWTEDQAVITWAPFDTAFACTIERDDGTGFVKLADAKSADGMYTDTAPGTNGARPAYRLAVADGQRATYSQVASIVVPFRFGATGGNLLSGGAWSAQGGMLYGRGNVEGKGPGLYASKLDGTGKTRKLAGGYMSQVNVLDGKVYYIALASAGVSSGFICSMPENGSAAPKKLVAQKVVFMLVVGNRIFFTLDGSGNLYSITTDGKGLTLLVKSMCGKLGYDGDVLYFEDSTKKAFCTLNLMDGKITQILLDYSGFCQMADGVLYYRDAKKQLCCCKPDGTEKKVLFSGGIDGLNVDGGYIYFANLADKGHPWRMKLDGTESQKLASITTELINTAGDTLFFINKSKKSVYMMDGKGLVLKIH